MASGKGHNGGFNPFRDSHGRFSGTAGGSHDVAHIAAMQPRKGGGAMNNALRTVSGRATSAPVAKADVPVITDERIAQIDTLPAPSLDSVSAATRAQLKQHLGDDFPGEDGLGFALSELSIMRQTGQIDDTTFHPLITKALDEAGYQAPANAGLHDILDMMDRVEKISDYATREKRQLFGASVAMKAGDLDAAYTFLDGPDGAGIGWTLQRNDIRDKLGLPPEHDEFA